MNGKTKRYPMTLLERHVTVQQAADALNIHPSFIYRRISEGEIEAVRISARRVIISERALASFLASKRTVESKVHE